MVIREISARFSGTSLGVLWLYVQPLLTVVTYYVVFDVVMKARLSESAPVRAVGIYLIVGIVPWMAFSDAVARGMSSLIDAGSLLQKNPLPAALFPAKTVIASALTYTPPMVVVIAFVGLNQGMNWAWFFLPALTIFLFILAFLLAYGISIMAAAMRDVLQVVGFCMSLGVFLSPVLFTPDMFPSAYAWLLWINPMTPVILGYQSILFLGTLPGGAVWFALAAWIIVLVLLLNRLIRRSEEHLVDWL
jgi:lipopolysaccharide transport system permease protein